MSNLTTFTPEKRAQFIEALEEGASIAKAAKAAGWSRQSAYNYREQDAEFAAQWDASLESGTDLLEDEARRRAVDGIQKPVFYQGYKCGSIREYSDTLLIVMLKARRPEKYRDNVKQDISGKLDVAIEATVTDYRTAAAVLAPPDEQSSSEMLAPEKPGE